MHQVEGRSRTTGSGEAWTPRLARREVLIRYLRSVLTYLAGPKYTLGSWPEGYKMFVHYKGPQDNPRTDKYLFGVSFSTTVIHRTS